MYKVKKASLVGIIAGFLFCFLFGYGIIVYPQRSYDGAYEALINCGRVLIPSLFPFMVLSQFAVYSGVGDRLSRLFKAPVRILFKLPECCAICIILSFIGGYPVGARMIRTMYARGDITREQAERMSYFCVGAGPAFVMGMVGNILFCNQMVGVVIFVSQLVASLILGIALSLRSKYIPSVSTKVKKTESFADSIVYAVSDASQGMTIMCFLVILFGSVLALLDGDWLGYIEGALHMDLDKVKMAISTILEVTNGCISCSKLGGSAILASFAVGFGGLCVHFQIFASLSDLELNKVKFVLCRFVSGILSAFFTYILFKFLPYDTQVAVVFGNETKFTSASNLLAGVSLILMVVIFLVSIGGKNNGQRRI
ncbi:MAG: hypothetical protein PUC88_01440 [Clostridia bacterium]|nr:hypothetical protein [Clostridia bacterium]